MPEVKIQDLVDLASRVLRKAGLAEDDAAVVISHLLDCELSDHKSHGFYRLPGILKSLESDIERGSFTVHKSSEAAALVDCGGNLGILAAQYSTNVALDMRSTAGVAIVGARNYIGTTGSMGFYARQIAQKGSIGIIMCNSEYAVAPTGGRQAILGTNPLAIGIPNEPYPIVIDFATAAWSYGALALAAQEGRRVPYGIVIDKQGHPSDNPADADDGAQLPMAAHKGYALGLAIEILAGPFIQAKAGRNAVPGSDGVLVLAFDAYLFSPRERFLTEVAALTSEIKASPKAPGSEEIKIPGEGSEAVRAANERAGIVTISSSLWAELQGLASGS